MFEKRKYGSKIRYRVTEAMSNDKAKRVARDLRGTGIGAQVDTWKGGYAIWADKKLSSINFSYFKTGGPRRATKTPSRPTKLKLPKIKATHYVVYASSGERREVRHSATSEKNAISIARQIVWKDKGVGAGDDWGVEVFTARGKRLGFFAVQEDGAVLTSGILQVLEKKTIAGKIERIPEWKSTSKRAPKTRFSERYPKATSSQVKRVGDRVDIVWIDKSRKSSGGVQGINLVIDGIESVTLTLRATGNRAKMVKLAKKYSEAKAGPLIVKFKNTHALVSERPLKSRERSTKAERERMGRAKSVRLLEGMNYAFGGRRTSYAVAMKRANELEEAGWETQVVKEDTHQWVVMKRKVKSKPAPSKAKRKRQLKSPIKVVPSSKLPLGINVIMECREGTSNKFWGWQELPPSKHPNAVDLYWGRIDTKTMRTQRREFGSREELEVFLSKKFKEKQQKGYKVSRV